MYRKTKAAAFLTVLALVFCQVPVMADVLPEYENTDFTWQEIEEGAEEFPAETEEFPSDIREDGGQINEERQYFAQSDTVKTYSLKEDGNTYLAPNFQVKEFACKDGSDQILIDSKLVEILQKIRDHFGAALTITSGYRTVSHNKKVGGASKSYHLYGMAADIKVSGHTPKEVAAYAETIGVKGIGLYSTWVHVDTRTSKYFWNSAGSTTFSPATFQQSAKTGDVDGDGSVSVNDSIHLLKAIVGIFDLTPEERQRSDADGSGTIGVSDAVYILKIVVNLV